MLDFAAETKPGVSSFEYVHTNGDLRDGGHVESYMLLDVLENTEWQIQSNGIQYEQSAGKKKALLQEL